MTQVWYMTWQQALSQSEQQRLCALLPPERRERWERTKDPTQRTQVLCAYGLLHLALRVSAGLETLPDIALGEQGKPYFPDLPDLHFSLSHTDGAALVGVSDAPIGVDIEKYRPLPPRVRKLLGEDLSETEALFRWTALEAHAKRTGKGVGAFLHGNTDLPPECTELHLAQAYAAGIACAGEFTVHTCTIKDTACQKVF